MTSLSLFQKELVEQIEQDSEFECWCLHPSKLVSGDRPDHPYPTTKIFCYYTKDGVLHIDRVGQRSVLRRITFPPLQEKQL